MEEKNEVIKQKTSEVIVADEQQFYTDVYFILQQAREKAYNSANGMPIGTWGSVLLSRNNMVKRKLAMALT